jgi:natural product biosynthesis luciferase-like monooxygenase protein
MTRLQDEIEAQGLWDLDSQVDQAMEALGCPPDDWAVDRLSGGRVDLSFSKGWNKSEFVFRGDVAGYDDDRMFADIATVRSLWSGCEKSFPTAGGEARELSIYPRPQGSSLSFWVSTFNEGLYVRSASEGGNVLTGLLLQSPAQLKAKIESFREVAAPGAQMTLMLHAFAGADDRQALEVVGAPFRAYLENSMTLWKQQEPRLDLSEAARQKVLDFAFARYLKESTLIGGMGMIEERLRFFQSIGVDEVACLLDFGAPADALLESLKRLATLAGSLAD